MNVLFLNQNDPLRDSGIIAMDLYNEFRKRGHNVKLLVNYYREGGYPDDIICFETKFKFKFRKLKKKITSRLEWLNPIKTNPYYHFHEVRERRTFYSTRKLLKSTGFIPDLIFVLFAKDFINSRNIYEFYDLTRAHIFWIMYDMAPFTGGCHYAWDCIGYQRQCGKCPGLYSGNPNDISHRNLLYKKKYISKTDIHIIAGSEWQYRQAMSSFLFQGKHIYKILLPFDPLIFRPASKSEAREKLGISSKKKVIFFGAVYMADKRKGIHYLQESLRILRDSYHDLNSDDIILLIAGRDLRNEALTSFVESLPFKCTMLEYLSKREEIASVYQASDVYLCPSIEDSGPSMINQSILCGTPVVSFEMGVALDLVVTGKTGYRARLKDSGDMAEGLHSILVLGEKEYQVISNNCREIGLRYCTHEVQIREFEKIMENSGNGNRK